VKLTGLTITDAQAAPRPATVAFDTRIRDISNRQSPIANRQSPTGVILPGLIDSHTHPMEAGLQKVFADLSGADSVEDVQARLRDRRNAALEHGMMLGFGLEPDRLCEHRYPDRGELDGVISEFPVFVYRVDGHSAVTNTAGLQLLRDKEPGTRVQGSGPRPQNPDPHLQGMETDCNGRPTGVLRGDAYEKASRVFKHRLSPVTVCEALRLAGLEAAAAGVTTVGALVGVDDTTDDEWRVLLDGLAASAVNAVPYLQTWDLEVPRRFGLRQAGGCLLIDGSFGSRTAALGQDYSDAPGNNGASYVTDEKLLSFLRGAADAGLQTAVHAIGDRAVEQVVRSHERLAEGRGTKDDGRMTYSNPFRHRLEHAELLNDSLISRIAELKLVLGVQPAFEREWGGPQRMYSQRLGERWRSTNPYRSLLESGVRLAGGSDYPITPIAPVAGIRATLERPNPSEIVKGEEALAMFTSAAAFALNRERSCGSIEPGKDADITVLTSDPRMTADCRLVATFRAGVCTYKNESLADYLKLED